MVFYKNKFPCFLYLIAKHKTFGSPDPEMVREQISAWKKKLG